MYTYSQLRTFCEIGLIKSLPDLVKNYHQNSKFGGALKKIARTAGQIQARRLPAPDPVDVARAGEKIEAFGNVTGWNKKKKSPVLMFCFIMRLLEESRYIQSKRLVHIMSDLLCYVEIGGEVKEQYLWAGDLAYTKWLSVWGEHDGNTHNPDVSHDILCKIDSDIAHQAAFESYREVIYGCLPDR